MSRGSTNLSVLCTQDSIHFRVLSWSTVRNNFSMARVIHTLVFVWCFSFFKQHFVQAQVPLDCNITFIDGTVPDHVTQGQNYSLAWSARTEGTVRSNSRRDLMRDLLDQIVSIFLFEGDAEALDNIKTLQTVCAGMYVTLEIVLDTHKPRTDQTLGVGVIDPDSPWSSSCAWTVPNNLTVGEHLLLGIYLYELAFTSTNFSDTIIVDADPSSTTVTTASRTSLAPTTQSSYSSAFATSTGTASKTSTSSDHATAPTSGSKGFSKGSEAGPEAGIAVGAICAVLFIVGVVSILLRRGCGQTQCCKALRERVRTSQDHYARAISSPKDVAISNRLPPEKYAEADPDNMIHEMPA